MALESSRSNDKPGSPGISNSSLYWSKLRPHFFFLWVYSHIGSWSPMTLSWPTQCLVQQRAHLHCQSSLGLLLQAHLALCALSLWRFGRRRKRVGREKIAPFYISAEDHNSFAADVEFIFLSRCLVVLSRCFAVQLHLYFPLQFLQEGFSSWPPFSILCTCHFLLQAILFRERCSWRREEKRAARRDR